MSSGVGDPSSSNNSATAATTVDPAADLSVTKTDSPDPVLAGQLLTYSLTVHNGGPQTRHRASSSPTTSRRASRSIPPRPHRAAARSRAAPSTCNLGSLADGAERDCRDQGPHRHDPGTITNQAGVSSDIGDPAASNNSASAETTVNAAADLSLSKTDSPDPLSAGDLLTYTLTVHNAGPQSATGVSLTDTLPADVTFVSATPSQGSCSQASGTVDCALGTLANGASASVEIQIRPQEGGTITNQASVSSDAGDPSPSDNSASAETTVTPVADISVTKTDSPDPVLAGEVLTYTVTVHNSGPSSATQVLLSDPLPAGVNFDSATPSQGTCSESGHTVGCALGTIANGAAASVEIKVITVTPGTISNQASVSSFVSDPNFANNDATAETTIDPAADLSLTKADSPDPVLVGQQLTYTLTVQNAGPQTATGVQLTDNLPAGVTFDSATPSQGSCSEASGTVDCALGTIADSEGASVEIKVTPQNAGVLTNGASVSSDVGDPDTADNSASAETTVNGVADLALSKSDSPDPVLAGELLTYSLTVQNAGPQAAPGVQLTDDLPAGVTFDSATPSQGSCSESSGTVTCALGTLADQQSATVELKVRPQSAGTITNQASVDSDAHDPASSNNSASAETTVDPAADLSVTKTDSPDPVLAGELLAYTVSVHNAGPSSAHGRERHGHVAGRRHLQLRHAVAGKLLGGERHRHLRPRHARGRTDREHLDRDRNADGGLPHEPGRRHVRRRRSGHLEQLRQRADDRQRAGARLPTAQGRDPAVRGARARLRQCTSPNTVHGLPLNSQSCTPPVPASTFLTTGSPDANGLSTRMTASLRLIARLGVTSTPADEADVRIVVSATDVRRQLGPDRLHRPARGTAFAPDHRPCQRRDGSRQRHGDQRTLRLPGPVRCHRRHHQRGVDLLTGLDRRRDHARRRPGRPAHDLAGRRGPPLRRRSRRSGQHAGQHAVPAAGRVRPVNR